MGPEVLSGSAAQKNGIPILSDDNYSDWEAAIRAFYLYIGFLDYINRYSIIPSESSPEMLAKYKELSKKAAGTICQSLDTNNRAKFLNRSNEKNPKLLYNKISFYYQSN
ncbi:hypothetical protein O181_053204 [Austropuccinia psidii MF-1]|uniref:Uncharacterized protein n=1 Tax=Austropuccinia psidii MF-1 TaxID=1389203 RepID=A0A9Q3HSF0_9BASI|nr:hypothetical protein [Austropuccinia psidii MF-1]